MSPRRAPSAPPTIPGYTYVQFEGAGGFADVFLYEQQRPRRRVAVKVLLADMLTAEVRRNFDAEADLMAQLSTHPSIVTIYEAGIATDGRPYLAMEYCPRPNLGKRYRREPFSVADALRIGIEVAGAVETAHRAGILHRDIKPANILVTEYDAPALTDFGISATMEGAPSQADGMSIPWSPPESFAEPPGSGVGTDVWALAATVYSLLAGRSPFEVPGGSNSSADLIARIERSPLPRLGRRDAPESLERVLATAMAKAPTSRYASALAFARALQHVQSELGLAATRAAVLDDVVSVEPTGDEDGEPGTRIRSIVSIDPAQPPTSSRPGPPAGEPGPAGAGRGPRETTSPGQVAASDTVVRGALPGEAPGVPPVGDVPDWGRAPVAPALDATVHRPEAPATEAAIDVAAPATRARWWGWLVAAVLVGVVAVAGFALTRGDAPSSGTPTSESVAEELVPQDVTGGVVAPPEELTGAVGDGIVVFTWVNPSPEEGDTFYYRVPDEFGEGPFQETAETTASVPASADGRTCFQVLLRRSTGKTSEPVGVCVP
ncbi:MAG TPA: serine/threonine-protein kinase [Actinotalea sp.]|nr:serine/threonine-protein kinase [Actinotalea sp.]